MDLMKSNNTYIPVPRIIMCNTLEKCGFIPSTDDHGYELVYERRHHIDPTMYIKVFTSMDVEGGDSRRCGSDAIRVAVIFKNPRTGVVGGLYKSPRVNRCGRSAEDVVLRTIDRARSAYMFATKRAKAQKQSWN